MNKPIKKYKSGNFSGVIWMNEREVDGAKVGFKTLTLTRSWKDKEQAIWRNEHLNFRRSDIPKIMAIMNKLQEDLFLSEEGDDDE
ncbi:hypothetical protein D6777_02610 [Candidatus Woesearchaeota archaeon]|nr:MAG: hypothetical protein D6777_02610 [Candidatus Woesearchaeota archaeon]